MHELTVIVFKNQFESNYNFGIHNNNIIIMVTITVIQVGTVA